MSRRQDDTVTRRAVNLARLAPKPAVRSLRRFRPTTIPNRRREELRRLARRRIDSGTIQSTTPP